MYGFPQMLSWIKLFKLFMHSIILMTILTFLVLFSTDIITLLHGQPIEKNTDYVVPMMLVWVIFALKSKKYRK